MAIIETKNLTKYYGKSRGISGIDLTVEKGEIFGFIGPNGAGKSTTIRTLLGLISPSSGMGTVLGFDILRQKTQILQKLGYMPGEAMFYGDMKVSEIIKLSANLRKQDCSAEARSLCDRLQLDTGKKIEELSLGNRKKVAIVCAMQHFPELYVLDEPTSGLDPLMQREFFSILTERHDMGATIFLSSHVLSEIQRNCTRAAIIREGKIIACDSVENLSRTSARRVTVHGIDSAPALSGMKDLKINEKTVSFLYQGNLPALISALNGLDISDLTITEPDLDEIFLHYYEKGGNTK